MSTDNAAEFAALNAAWKRRCIGVETLQSAPLAVLLLIALCEPRTLTPRSGDIITDMIRGIGAAVDDMADRIDDLDAADLRDVSLRVDVLHELRRRERGGGPGKDPRDGEVTHDA